MSLPPFLRSRQFNRDTITAVLDLGARDGTDALELAEAFPEATVIAVEWEAETLATARVALAGHPRVRLVERSADAIDLEGLRLEDGTSFFDLVRVDSRTEAVAALMAAGILIDATRFVYVDGADAAECLGAFLRGCGFRKVTTSDRGARIHESTRTFVDVMIPLGPRDESLIAVVAEAARANIANLRHIFLVAATAPQVTGVRYIPESAFPFSRETVAATIRLPNRAGWYLQQLIKLHFQTVVPAALDHVLAIDADTIFLKPCTFVEGETVRLSAGTEMHQAYFDHMARLHPSLRRRKDQVSGIAHCMLFTRRWVEELRTLVERHHRGTPFWQVFLTSVDPAFVHHSGASEYEIYFNYVVGKHAGHVKIGAFRWSDMTTLDFKDANYDYVSFHWYKRGPGIDATSIREALAAMPIRG